MTKIRLCSKCHIGVPHWLTDGHGSDFVKCENCGNEIEVPYDCKDFWDRWNEVNSEGILVEWGKDMDCRSVKNILDMRPEWSFQEQISKDMRKMDEEIRDLRTRVIYLSDKVNDARCEC